MSTAALIVTALLCTTQCQQTPLYVWDGDTFSIGAASGSKVRLANIDAPEIKGRCSSEIVRAKKAKARLADLLRRGAVEVYAEGHDRYGRILAIVWVSGQDAGDTLVAEGLARTWTGRRLPWC